MLDVDGSYGEGGGQILRTALGLSSLLRKPFRMFNIRKGRHTPGLMPQHLTCVRALMRICGAKVRGDAVGSTEIVFDPAETKAGEYFFDVGTAGSTSLLLEAILPALLFARGPSQITLRGGTHVPHSPSYHFLSEVFVPMLRRLGVDLEVSIARYGFYPKGGGQISVRVHPAKEAKGLTLTRRGEITSISGISSAANLPVSIAERQKASAETALAHIPVNPEIRIEEVQSFSPGTFLFLKAGSPACVAGFSSLGERGKRAETVGQEAARQLALYVEAGACLDHHLADQIVLYLFMARERSEVTTCCVTGHLMTNLRIIGQFVSGRYSLEGERGKPGRVTVFP